MGDIYIYIPKSCNFELMDSLSLISNTRDIESVFIFVACCNNFKAVTLLPRN